MANANMKSQPTNMTTVTNMLTKRSDWPSPLIIEWKKPPGIRDEYVYWKWKKSEPEFVYIMASSVISIKAANIQMNVLRLH